MEEKLFEEKNECSRHGKEIRYFCKESCQLPICAVCLTDNHKGHAYGDFEEETEQIHAGLMEDIQWMKDALLKEKEHHLKIQKIVTENCQECTAEVRDLQEYLTRKINQRAGNLFNFIMRHQTKSDTTTNKVIDNIDQKLAVVKDFEKIAKSKTVFEVDIDRLEQFKLVKNKIQLIFSKKTPYTFLTYMKCGDTKSCLSKLCGKLKIKDKQMKVIESDCEGPAASPKTCSWLKEERAPDILVKTAAMVSKFNNASRESAQTVSSHKTSDTEVPVVQESSMDQNDADRKEKENAPDELLNFVNSLIEKAAKLLPSTNPATPDGNSLCLQSEGNIGNLTSTNSGLNGETVCTQAAVSFDESISSPLGIIAGNSQSAENGAVHNQPRANNVQPAVNPLGYTPQTTNIWNSRSVETLPAANNIEPAVNTTGLSLETTNIWNSQPVETLPAANNIEPAVNTTSLSPQTTNIWNSQPVETLPTANNVEPAVNTTGISPQTTNIWNSQPVETLPIANTVEPAVNTTGISPETTNMWNSRSVETLPAANNIAVNTTGLSIETTNIWNSQPRETPPAAINVEPAVNTTGFSPQTTNIGSSQPGENAVTNKQTHDSTAPYSRSENADAVNIQALPGSMPPYPQPANCLSPEQPAEAQLVDAKSSMAEPYSPGEVLDLNEPLEDPFHLHTEPVTMKTHLESPQDHLEKNQPAKNTSVFHLTAPSTTESMLPAMNAAVKKQVTTNGDFCEGNDSRKTSRVFRKSRWDLPERSAGAREWVEPETKKRRLMETPKKDSQTNSQGPWQEYGCFAVVQSFSTGLETVSAMDVLPDNNILVSGKGSNQWRSGTPKFLTFNRKTGNVSSARACMPDGMAVFTIADGSERIALSYGERKVIDFYDVNDMHKALQTYSVAPNRPGPLCACAASPGTLVYTDCYSGEHWLDCNHYPPRTKIQMKHVRNYSIQDMCCVTFGNNNLLVTTHSYSGVYAYVAGTDELKWYTSGNQYGVDKWMNAVGITNNGRGQLFVCDVSNNCIQMLSTDGTFLGTILRLENPQRIRWCSKTSSLVIAYRKQGLFSISFFQ